MGPTSLSGLAGAALAAATLAGCGGARSGGSTVQGAPEGGRILLAVMGGNTSCAADPSGASTPYGMKMYQPFKQLADDLHATRGLDVDFFLSCHNSDATVHYYASDKPDQLVDAGLDAIAGKIEDLAQSRGATRLFVAGHSYGGWLAMKTGLALPAARHIDGFFTIDPISRVNCTFANPGGCTEAPSDIGTDERKTLKERSSAWYNYWETGTFYLHSSAIDEADHNAEVPGATHYTIETEAQVWQAIADTVGSRI